MSDQIVAALITGGCAIVAALIGLLARRLRDEEHASLAPGAEAPVFRDARAFAAAGDAARRRQFIQQIELALSRGLLWLTPEQQAACAGSEWELDRIGLYLFEMGPGQARPADRVLHVRHELERLSNGAGAGSSLPLRHALISLLSAAREDPSTRRLVSDNAAMLLDLRRLLRAEPTADAAGARVVDTLLSLVRAAA